MDIDSENLDRAQELKDQGNDFYRQKMYQNALEKYDEAIKLNKNDIKLYTNKAACFIEMKQYLEAIEQCHLARQCDLKFDKIYFREGQAYSSMNDFLSATSSYGNGLVLFPSSKLFKDLYIQSHKKLGGKYNFRRLESEDKYEKRIDQQQKQFDEYVKQNGIDTSSFRKLESDIFQELLMDKKYRQPSIEQNI